MSEKPVRVRSELQAQTSSSALGFPPHGDTALHKASSSVPNCGGSLCEDHATADSPIRQAPGDREKSLPPCRQDKDIERGTRLKRTPDNDFSFSFLLETETTNITLSEIDPSSFLNSSEITQPLPDGKV